MLIVEMTFKGIASAELLAAASNHLLTSPDIRLGIRWEVIILCILDRDPTADPLCRAFETGVSTDMALEIRRTVVALYPLAVRTGPWIRPRYRGRRYGSRGGLSIAGEWGMTRPLAGCTLSGSLLRRGSGSTEIGSSRSSVPFLGAQSGRRNIFVLRAISVTL